MPQCYQVCFMIKSGFGLCDKSQVFLDWSAHEHCSLRVPSTFLSEILISCPVNVIAAGTATFDQLVVSGCIQEGLVLRFSAPYLTTVTSAPFDVFMEPNLPNITGKIHLHNMCSCTAITARASCRVAHCNARGLTANKSWFPTELHRWSN